MPAGKAPSDKQGSAGSQPALPADLSGLPAAELRRVVVEAGRAEDGLSFLRRMVQGRADIVAAEVDRRRTGAPPGDVADLIRRLPAILGEHPPASARNRPVSPTGPGDVDPVFEERLNRLVSPDQLVDLAALPADDVEAMIAGLTDLERDVSEQRRNLQQLVDRIRAEIGRRYQVGEISPEGVFDSGDPAESETS